MADRSTIAAVFKLLMDAQVKKPKEWEDGKKLRGAIDTWHMLLDDVADKPLLVAAKVYARQNNQWWPTPGQLLALIPESGPAEVGWEGAWKRIVAGFSRYGRDKPPGLPAEGKPLPPGVAQLGIVPAKPAAVWRLADDPDENEAAMVAMTAAGGWTGLCDMDDHALGFARTAFRNSFAGFMARKHEARRWAAAGGRIPGPEVPRLTGPPRGQAIDITAEIDRRRRERGQ